MLPQHALPGLHLSCLDLLITWIAHPEPLVVGWQNTPPPRNVYYQLPQLTWLFLLHASNTRRTPETSSLKMYVGKGGHSAGREEARCRKNKSEGARQEEQGRRNKVRTGKWKERGGKKNWTGEKRGDQGRMNGSREEHEGRRRSRKASVGRGGQPDDAIGECSSGPRTQIRAGGARWTAGCETESAPWFLIRGSCRRAADSQPFQARSVGARRFRRQRGREGEFRLRRLVRASRGGSGGESIMMNPAREQGVGRFFNPLINQRNHFAPQVCGVVQTREFIALQGFSRSFVQIIPRGRSSMTGH